jgi:hypothetical protein
MAVLLQMTYSKKLGLPNFSSHSCAVSLQVEIADTSQVSAEVKRLYALTQDSVDHEIQQVGWMPADPAYGLTNGTGHPRAVNGRQSPSESDAAPITEKQLDLIQKVVKDNHVSKQDVEQMALQMFGSGVLSLKRTQASKLIEDLLDLYGRRPTSNNRYRESSRA